MFWKVRPIVVASRPYLMSPAKIEVDTMKKKCNLQLSTLSCQKITVLLNAGVVIYIERISILPLLFHDDALLVIL